MSFLHTLAFRLFGHRRPPRNPPGTRGCVNFSLTCSFSPMWMACGIQPRSVVHPDSIHQQGVAFPVRHRISEVIRIRIRGLLPSVHPDDALQVRASFIDQQDAVGQLRAMPGGEQKRSGSSLE